MADVAAERAVDVAFAVPGDIESPTGGYAYARQILARLRPFGVTPHLLALPDGFPDPSGDDVARTRQHVGTGASDHAGSVRWTGLRRPAG